jgi:hypothetical protein
MFLQCVIIQILNGLADVAQRPLCDEVVDCRDPMKSLSNITVVDSLLSHSLHGYTEDSSD